MSAEDYELGRLDGALAVRNWLKSLPKEVNGKPVTVEQVLIMWKGQIFSSYRGGS